MLAKRDRNDAATPLQKAIDRLIEIKENLQETRSRVELGETMPTGQLTRQLDDLDKWLDELMPLLVRSRRSP